MVPPADTSATRSLGRSRAVDLPLSSEQEERLAALVEELSETIPSDAQSRLEQLAAAHSDLAGQLRELFAAMLVTDAVAQESTILDLAGPRVREPAVQLPAADADSLPRFVPGVTRMGHTA